LLILDNASLWGTAAIDVGWLIASLIVRLIEGLWVTRDAVPCNNILWSVHRIPNTTSAKEWRPFMLVKARGCSYFLIYCTETNAALSRSQMELKDEISRK
jgi:hypothetical protein